MALAVGDILHKIDPETNKPVDPEKEAHVLFEVLETSYETDSELRVDGSINSTKLKILE